MKERRPSYDEIRARLDRAEALIEAFKKPQVDETCAKEQLVKLKETEEALQASEQKYRLIADNAADMIWTMNRDVRFTSMSPSCFPMIGFTPEEMMEKEPIEFLPDDSYKILTKTLREELAMEASGAGEPSRTRIEELELLCKDGSNAWTESVLSFIRDSRGEPIGVMGITRDITERKRTEEALRENEEKYRVLIEGTSDYIFMIDDEGKVQSANRSAAVLFRKKYEDIEGKYILELFPKEIAEDYLADLQEVIISGEPRSTVSKLVVGEEEIWIDTSLNPVKDMENKVTAVIGVSRDISDRKKAEEALKESKEKLSAILQKSPIPTAVGGSDGSIVSFNEALERLIGYKAFEIKDVKDWGEKLYPCKEYRDFVEKNIGQALAGRKQECTEFTVTCKDGSIKSIDFYTSFFKDGLIIQMIDVTGKREVEEALQESEKKFRTITENSPDAIFITDRKGNYVYVNGAATDLLGYSAEELTKMNIADVSENGQVEEDLEGFHRLLDKGSLFTELNLVKKDGSLIPTDLNALILPNGQVYGSCRDITVRKRAQRALRDSEDRYRTLFEAGSDSIFVTDAETLHILNANNAASELYGYSHEELVKLRATDLSAEPHEIRESIASFSESGRTALDMKAFVPIRMHRKKDGTVFPVEITSNQFEADGRIINVTAMRDITERIRSEKALRDSEEKFRTIVDNSFDGIYIRHGGRYTYVNPRFCEITGYSSEELTSPDFDHSMLVDEGTGEFLKQRFEARKRDEEIQNRYNIHIQNRSGKRIELDVIVVPTKKDDKIGAIGFMKDITEQKDAENAICREKDFAKNLYETAQTIMLILDTEGRIVQFNPYMEEVSGYSLDEVKGNDWFSTFIPRSDHAKIRKLYMQAIGDIQTRGNINPIITKDGKLREIEWYDKTLKDSNGEIIGLLSVGQDVTEHKEAEKALLRSEKEHRTLFETILHGIVYQNADGRITSANPSAERILGLTLDQMKGITSMDPRWRAIHENGSDFPGDTHPAMVTLRTGKVVTDVIMGVFNPRFDDYTWININSVPHFRDGEDRPYQVYTTFEDITGRKKAKDEIEKLSKFPNENLNPVLRIGKDNVILYANDASRSLLKEWNCSIGQPVPESVWSIVKERFDTGHTRDLETQCGNIIFNLTFTPVGNENYINIYGADVTEHKGAIAAMAESEAKMRSMLENSPDLITIVNRDHRILYINRTVRRSLEDVVGTSIYDFAQPDQREEYLKVITEVFQTGDTSKIVAEIMDAQGKTAWYENRLAPIKQGDEILFVMIISTDITARKNALEELENSLREKDTLLKEIHHRVKNNMQVISSVLNLQSRQSKNEEVREVLGKARNRVQSMSAIHEQLYRSGDLSRIDMAQYLGSLTNGLYRAYGVDPGRIMLKLDVRDISMGVELAIPCGLIVNELVSNSLKYAFPPGWTGKALSGGDRTSKGEIFLSLRREPSGEDGSAVLYNLNVRDNGIGASDEDELRKTDGLGMRLVEILTDQLDGNIEIERETGLCYRITFGGGE